MRLRTIIPGIVGVVVSACSTPDFDSLRGEKDTALLEAGRIRNGPATFTGRAGSAGFTSESSLEEQVRVAEQARRYVDGGYDSGTPDAQLVYDAGDAGTLDGHRVYDGGHDASLPDAHGIDGSFDAGTPDARNGSDAGDASTPDGSMVYDGGRDASLPDAGAGDASIDAGSCDTPMRWYNDADHDGRRTNEFREACTATVPFTLPASALFDCDDEDGTRFQYLNGVRDADTDSFTFGNPEPVCSGTELPVGWRSERSQIEDCDDLISSCTNDCTTAAYIDGDSDNFRGEENHRACDAPQRYRLRETAALDCDDTVASCTMDCTTLVYIDGDGDGRRSQLPHRACDALANLLPESAPIDCDDAVASCTEDCVSVVYINADGDAFRGRTSHRVCDAPMEYTLDETAQLDCDDAVFNASLEDAITCGPNNRGRQVRACVDGVYQLRGECLPNDECVENTSRRVPCSRNVGICQEGQETERCAYNAMENRFLWVLQGDCDGILPGVEDPEGIPTLLDENCDGVAMRAYKIPVGLVYVGCDVTIDPPRCNGSALPMHPAELPELLDANGKIIHRLLTDEIPLLLYRECVSQGVCTDPADRRSRTDNGYYSNPVKINGGYPVTATTWMQSRTFCAWLSGDAGDIAAVQADPFVHRRLKGDLPTEAEWFMAANGPYAVRDETGSVVAVDNAHATTHYTWGNESPNCTRANFRDPNVGDCFGDFQPVYSLPAGVGFAGAHHLNGNGVEWVFNIFENYTGGPDSIPDHDPLGPAPTGTSDQRVKMGSWYLRPEGEILTSNRISEAPDRLIRITAFRCVVRSPYEP